MGVSNRIFESFHSKHSHPSRKDYPSYLDFRFEKYLSDTHDIVETLEVSNEDDGSAQESKSPLRELIFSI